MANIVEMTYTFITGTAKNHFSKSGGMNLDQAGLVSQPLILWYSNSGTATMNTTGKNFLYPKAGVHPFKADYAFITWNGTDSDLTSNPSSYMNFYFRIDNNEIYHKELPPGKTSSPTSAYDEITNDTNSAILNSTLNSSITFEITAQKNGLAQMAGISAEANGATSYVKFYYKQWDLLAQKVGDGVGFVCAPSRVYDGESVDYYCITGGNCTFHGWYSDAAHTQLVSSSYRYTVTASQDLTLYAYITKNSNICTDVYTRNELNNSNTSKWIKPYFYYIKTTSGWQKYTDKSYIDTSLALQRNVTWTTIDSLGTSSATHSYNIHAKPYGNLAVYIRNPNNLIFTDWQNSAPNFTCCPMEEGLGIYYNGTSFSGTQTIVITCANQALSNTNIVHTLNFTINSGLVTRAVNLIYPDNSYHSSVILNYGAYTMPSIAAYPNLTGWKEYYNGIATGRILEAGNSYYDVGYNSAIHYEPVYSS